MNSYEPLNRDTGNFDYNSYNPSYNYDQPYGGYNNIPSQNNYQYNQPNYSYDQSSTDNDSSLGTPPESFNYYDQLNYANNENSSKIPFDERSFEQNPEVPFEPNELYEPSSTEQMLKENKFDEKVVSMYFDNDPSDEFRPPPAKSVNADKNSINEDKNKTSKVISNGVIVLDDDPSDEFSLPKNVSDLKTNELIDQMPVEKNEKIISLNEDTMSDLDENEIENDAYTPGLEWNRFKPIRPKSVASEIEKDISKEEENFNKSVEEKTRKVSTPQLIGKSIDKNLNSKDSDVKSGSLETKSMLKGLNGTSIPTLVSKSLEINKNNLIRRKIKIPKLVSTNIPAEVVAKLKTKDELDEILLKDTENLKIPKSTEKSVFQPEIVMLDKVNPKIAQLVTKPPIILKPISTTEIESLSVKPSLNESNLELMEAKTSESGLKNSDSDIKPKSPKSILTAVNESKNVFKPISVSPGILQVSFERFK